MSVARRIRRGLPPLIKISRPLVMAPPSRTLVVHGVSCIWWDSIFNAGTGAAHGLPCCPHCYSMLYQIEEADWWANVDRYERDHPEMVGYRKLVEWQRGKCFPDMAAAVAAMDAELALAKPQEPLQ